MRQRWPSSGLVPLPGRIDRSIAQGFGFVVAARGRSHTPRISSSRAGATEPKNKRAAGRYASGAALVHSSCEFFPRAAATFPARGISGERGAAREILPPLMASGEAQLPARRLVHESEI